MLRASGAGGPPYAGMGTFAQMKALAAPADNTGYLVTNYGRGGSMWRYSVALSDWFPTAPVLIYENTTLISGLVQAAAQTLLAIPVEANLLKGKRFRALVTTAKSGTTDTITTSIRLGATGTAADTTIGTLAAMSGTSRAIGTETWLLMTSATNAIRLGGSQIAPFANIAQTVAALSAFTVGDVTATNYVSMSCTMSGTTDTPQLGYTALEILP